MTAETLDPLTSLRELLVNEIQQEAPHFPLIETYIKALKTALARDGKASLESAGVENEARTYLTVGNNVAMATEGYGDVNGYRRRDQAQDTQLAAIEDVVARSGPDPLAAILQSFDTAQSLYEEADRPAFLARLRAQVEARLPALPLPETP